MKARTGSTDAGTRQPRVVSNMGNDDIAYMTASEMARRFRDKSLSPTEVMNTLVERIPRVNDGINALSHTFFELGLEQARASETRFARGEPVGVLDGIPVAIKDESFIQGMPCSSGSLVTRDFIASTTSPYNQRILDAGGIPHVRTTTPEFSCSGVTWSKLWGVTRNPWNTEFTPGGSSGGASACLAAGMSPLAMGSDIGGSIRIPASAGGVAGFKPPYGRNPEDPPFNLDVYCHNGPMARSVADTILLQNVLSGPHPLDIASIKPKLTLPDHYDTIQGWKIAFSMDLGFYEVEPEVQANTLAALDVFRDLGAIVEEVEIPWSTDIIQAGLDYLNHLFGFSMVERYEQHGELLTPYAIQFAQRGKASSNRAFWNSVVVAGDMYKTLGPILQEYNLFICPTNNLAAVAADHDQSADRVVINGKEVDPLLGWVMTLPFNMLSRCPVMSVPSGHRKDNVPTGIQLVGPALEDEVVMQAAMAYESAVDGWYNTAHKRPAF